MSGFDHLEFWETARLTSYQAILVGGLAITLGALVFHTAINPVGEDVTILIIFGDICLKVGSGFVTFGFVMSALSIHWQP
jgi:hypothetical protein